MAEMKENAEKVNFNTEETNFDESETEERKTKLKSSAKNVALASPIQNKRR